jgi:hypothetical protein
MTPALSSELSSTGASSLATVERDGAIDSEVTISGVVISCGGTYTGLVGTEFEIF